MRAICFWVVALLVAAEMTVQAAPRVALMDFGADDNSYRSALAAENFSALLQARLEDVHGVEWVERNQWKNAAQELKLNLFDHGVRDALRVGKWLKADLLVTGQFRTSEGHRWELRMEVIDLNHADVLAESRIEVGGQTNEALKISASVLDESVRALRAALATAEAQRAKLQGQVKIAPLFFSNAGKSLRLDFLENDIVNGFQTPESTVTNLHVLRLPRAREATEEAELVIDGLVENDAEAWQRVADVYVWGSYAEQDVPGLPFEKVPVDATWYVWDGATDPQTFSETVTAGELPKLVARITQSGIKAAQAIHGHAIKSSETRSRAANVLLKRANEINGRFDGASSLYATPQGQVDWQYQADVLDAARFFDPQNQSIQEQALVRRWAPLWATPAPAWFRADLLMHERCASDYEEYVEKFGVSHDGKLNYPLLRSYLECVRGAIAELADSADDPAWQAKWPEDATEAWRGRVETNFLERIRFCDQAYLQAAKKGSNDRDAEFEWTTAYSGLWDFTWHKVHSAAIRAQIFEDIWTTAPSWVADDWFVDSLKRTYAEIDEPEKGQQLVDELLTVVRKRNHPPQMPVQNPESMVSKAISVDLPIPPLDILPPVLTPWMQVVDFSATPQGIVTLDHAGDRLWISSQSIASDRHSEDMFSTPSGLGIPEPLFPKLMSPAQANLTEFDPASHKPTDLTSRLQIHSKITSIVSGHDDLWLTSQGDGILRMNPKTGDVQHFGPREGVVASEFYAGADAGDALIFGGGNVTDGHLSVFNKGTAKWSEEKPVASLKQVTLASSYGKHVLIIGQDFDGAPSMVRAIQVLLSDEGQHAWKDMTKPLLSDSPRAWKGREIIAASSDEKGFWLGSGAGLFFVGGDGQTVKKWYTPPGQQAAFDRNGTRDARVARPFTRLRGAVTALAQDGEFLWIAASGDWDDYMFHRRDDPPNFFRDHNENYVFLMHKPSGRWLGCFSVPARVSALAVSANDLWIGLAKPENSESLFRIDKRPLLQTPQDRWVADDVSDEEMYRQIEKLDVIEQAHYFILLGDTDKALAVLQKPTAPDYAEHVKELISVCSGTLEKTSSEVASTNLSYDFREAIREGDMEKVRTLFPLLSDTNDLNWALGVAASWGKTDAVKFLLAQGLNVNVHLEGWNGGTPLTAAAENGRTATVEELVARGAQLEGADNDGNTALHNAARFGNAKTVAVLLEKGASVNAQKGDGWTPLMLAVHSGSIATTKTLLLHDAALNLANTDDDTALAIATKDHRKDMVALLKNPSSQ